MSSGHTQKLGTRYDSLNHWRGIAALGVVIFHGFRGMKVHPSMEWLAWLGNWGWLGVHVFFVISGYCIASSLFQWVGKGHSAAQFLKDRFLRIFPAYWVACLVALAIAVGVIPLNHTTLAHNLPEGWGAFAANLLLVQPYVDVDPILLVSWTLVYEVGFYILVAMGLFLYQKGMPWPWLVGMALALALAGLCQPLPPFLAVLKYWSEFLCGGVVFVALWMLQNRLRGAYACMMIPILFCMVSFYAPASSERTFQLGGAAVFSWLLLLLHRYDGKINECRPLRPLSWLGMCSYSIYLIHIPTMGRVINLGVRYVPSESPFHIGLQIVGWLIAVLCGWIFFKAVERPMEDWRMRWKKSLQVRPGFA